MCGYPPALTADKLELCYLEASSSHQVGRLYPYTDNRIVMTWTPAPVPERTPCSGARLEMTSLRLGLSCRATAVLTMTRSARE